MKSLGEKLPEECVRVRELLCQYKAIGLAGAFGAVALEAALNEADKAMISGDATLMLQAYKSLSQCQ